MIMMPRDYDTTAVLGSFRQLPKGGYICRIIKAEEILDKNKKPMVHIAFDIADGEFNSYFMEMFNHRKSTSDNPNEVKYPFEGQMWIPVYDYEDASKTSRKFKTFCTALIDSGTEVWTDKKEFLIGALRGATIGIVYQMQEQEYEGKTPWRAIPWGCRSVKSIETGDYFVPSDKPLKRDGGSDYSAGVNSALAELGDTFATAEDDIPF